jgi:hypothetical protein
MRLSNLMEEADETDTYAALRAFTLIWSDHGLLATAHLTNHFNSIIKSMFINALRRFFEKLGLTPAEVSKYK